MRSVIQARPPRKKTFILWLAANALDAATTFVGLRLGRVEGSPFPGFILARFGATAFWALKTCLTLVLPVATVYLAKQYLYAESFAWKFMGFSTAVVVLVFGQNCYVIAR